MEPKFPIKRLFRIALYSSTAIGLITMGPVYVITFSFGIIQVHDIFLFRIILLAVFGISILVFLFWTINIFLSYLTNKLYPLYRKNITRYLWSYIACFLVFILNRIIISGLFLNESYRNYILNWKIRVFGLHTDNIGLITKRDGIWPYLIIVIMVISVNTVVLIIQGLALLLEKKNLIESENVQLKIKNIEASNQQLKQQLHPHFLFNSLSTLKTLIKKNPDHAEEYLMKLSDFLRASISNENTNTVSLKEELKLCHDYLDMQKIRFGDALKFEVNIPEEKNTGFVPLFSLQLLLENAIKHNSLTDETPLFIKIFYENERIVVSNNRKKKFSTLTNTGMGLANLSERYKIISGDELIIYETDTTFSVSIKILGK
jgi:two-component system, LytTR family, sensor kinase